MMVLQHAPKVHVVCNIVCNAGDGYMSKSEVKVLISKMTGCPASAISDNHPEVITLSDISSDELVDQLEKMADKATIDNYFEMLGLGENATFMHREGDRGEHTLLLQITDILELVWDTVTEGTDVPKDENISDKGAPRPKSERVTRAKSERVTRAKCERVSRGAARKGDNR